MSEDMQATDPVPHLDGPSGSRARQEIPGSATITHDMEHLDQGNEEMDNRQYTTGEIEMMFNDGLFGSLTEADNSGQVENNEMHTAGQQEPATMSESYSDNTVPAFPGDNYPILPMDEDNTQPTRLDEGGKNPHRDATSKPAPESEGEIELRDLNMDHSMGEPGHGGEMHSSTLQHMRELLQDVTQETIMKDESGYQGHQFTDHTGEGEVEHEAEVHTHQDEHGVTIPTNQGLIWSENPGATDIGFEKESQHTVLQKNHEDVQSEQQYSGSMASGTADKLLDPRSREVDQSSTFTEAVDFWKHRPSMQLGYEGNTMSMTGKETVGQHTQPSNAPMSGLSPASGMNEIQHQAFGRPIDFTSTFTSPHLLIQNTTPFATSNTFPSFQPTQHFPQQQPLNPYNQNPVDTLFARQQQLQAQVEEKRRQLENARRMHEQTQCQAQQVNSLSFTQNPASGPASFLMGPLSYQRAPQSGYRQVPSGNSSAGHWPQMQSGSLQSQMRLNEEPASYPMQGQEAVGKSTDVNTPIPGPSTASKTQQQDQSKSQQPNLEEEPNDDEPLITRTKCHPSITSQTSASNQLSTSQISVPPITGTSSPPSVSSAPNTTIDWKLPQYDIHIDPTPADPTQPIAKVSLPGLVREELLLSPDHADQEIHLLVNVFLPGQRALTTPDPQPAVAVLNFHTIALMVIEAYVQFEIGDELGRRNPCYAPANENSGTRGGEAEYERIRDARNADVDEVFFAVVDRWRAGRESGKQSLGLIRGVQEFCDVALDVIYYVKENGLLGAEEAQEQEDEYEEEDGVEEEVKTKGKGKGKAVDKKEGVAVLKAKPKGKRTAVTEKAETGARKKGKATVKKEEPKKRGRKPAGGITVVKR